METQTITKKKVQFGKGNEVTGWFKVTSGKKTEFKITNDGEVIQTGDNENIHPFLLGLCEMLFTNE